MKKVVFHSAFVRNFLNSKTTIKIIIMIIMIIMITEVEKKYRKIKEN